MKTPMARKAFGSWKQFLICIVCSIAIMLAATGISRLLARGTIAARPYWWGVGLDAFLGWSLAAGFAASLIAAMHETADRSILHGLATRMRFVLATAVPAVCVVGILAFVGAALEPKNRGLPSNIGMLPSTLSVICMFLLYYASAFAGAVKMGPLAAFLASLRFVKSCSGAALLFLCLAVPLATSVALSSWVGHRIPVFSGPIVGGVFAVIVGARVWNVSEQMYQVPGGAS